MRNYDIVYCSLRAISTKISRSISQVPQPSLKHYDISFIYFYVQAENEYGGIVEIFFFLRNLTI